LIVVVKELLLIGVVNRTSIDWSSKDATFCYSDIATISTFAESYAACSMSTTQSRCNMLSHSFTLDHRTSTNFLKLAPRPLKRVRPQNQYRSATRYLKFLTNHCEPVTFSGPIYPFFTSEVQTPMSRKFRPCKRAQGTAFPARYSSPIHGNRDQQKPPSLLQKHPHAAPHLFISPVVDCRETPPHLCFCC
jgi:hypothetical protein